MEQNTKGLVTRITDYLLSAYEELNKVAWPSRQQTRNYTVVVIILSLAMLVFFMALDFIFEGGIRAVIQ